MWNPAPRNIGMSSNLGTTGGIPNNKPKWTIGKLGNHGPIYDMMVAKDNFIYFCSSGDIYCVDNNTGYIKWSYENGIRNKVYRGMAIIDDFLLVDFVLYNMISGELLYDYSKEFEPNLKGYTWTWTYNNFFIKKINRKDQHLTTFDPISKSIDKIYCNLKQILCYEEFVFGWSDSNNFRCFNLKDNTYLWNIPNELFINSTIEVEFTQDQLPKIQAIGNFIFLTGGYSNVLCCIDKLSGNILWQHDKNSENSEFNGKINKVSLTEKIFYFSVWKDYEYTLMAIDAQTGNKIWEYKNEGNEYIVNPPLVLGDLVFDGRIASNNADVELFALDRFTGKDVWIADELQITTNGLIGHQNKILYSNTYDEIRCFEWIEEYISPFRDKEPPKLVSNKQNASNNKNTTKPGWLKKIFK